MEINIKNFIVNSHKYYTIVVQILIKIKIKMIRNYLEILGVIK